MAQESQISPESGSLYFDLQADFGITKHMGGQAATRELAALCRIGPGMRVLEVGCGVGATSRLLASEYGCQVVSVDLAPRMVARARARVEKRGVTAQVLFAAADAQQLPFGAGQFDAVLDESVMAFVPDKGKAMAEYRRVTRPGGCVGLNQVSWTKTPPPDLVRYIGLIMAGADFLTGEGWTALLDEGGLRELEVRSHKFDARQQRRDEIQQMDWKESARAWYRFITQSFTNPAYRRFTREVLRVPRNIFQFMNYIGYGLYAGRV